MDSNILKLTGSPHPVTSSQLQEMMKEHHAAMTRLQAHAHAQQIQANLRTTSLRARLRRKDTELTLTRERRDQEISAVLAHLLYLEGQIQKDHDDVADLVREKDDVIRRQKAAIDDLASKNEKLLKALKESHGYSSESGNSRSKENQVVTQNGNYSIQDHGNKVVLRGNKVRNGASAGHKVRFGNMKEKLRRHKSSLELRQIEPLDTLFEGSTRNYGSQENLVDSQEERVSKEERKERCRSLVDYPFGLRDVNEVHNESPDSCFSDELNTSDFSQNDSVNSSTTSLVNGRWAGGDYNNTPAPQSKDSAFVLPSSSELSFGFNELSKSRSVPQSLPTVSENDTGRSLKERPHSLPSVDLLASEGEGSKVKSSPNPIPVVPNSPPSESNPFKTFKNVFMRRGSKKKRSVSLGQNSNKEYHDALKQHFKKYDLT